MICDVIATFKDKNTGTFHYPGDKYECTEERFKEINSAYEGISFIVEAEEKPAKKRRTAKKAESAEVSAE